MSIEITDGSSQTDACTLRRSLSRSRLSDLTFPFETFDKSTYNRFGEGSATKLVSCVVQVKFTAFEMLATYGLYASTLQGVEFTGGEGFLPNVSVMFRNTFG
jgi:hypothetical protein